MCSYFNKNHQNQRRSFYLNYLILLCILGCNPSSPEPFPSSLPNSPLVVNVIQPTRTERAIKTASYFGKLIPRQKLTLGFRTGGFLKTIAKNGEEIQSGQLIAELDSESLANQQGKLEIELEQLISQFGDSPENSAAQQSLRSEIENLQRQIEQRKILAPFDCVVETSFASQNSLVGPNSPVASIFESKSPIIEINMPRRIAEVIGDDQTFFFLVDEQLIRGRLVEKGLTEKPTGTLAVTFELESQNQEFRFSFGQSVEGRFSFETDTSGFWLPLSALQRTATGLWSVLTVETDQQKYFVRQRLIEIGQLRDKAALVTNDLANALVIADGIHRVVNGQEVTINVLKTDSSEDVASDQ